MNNIYKTITILILLMFILAACSEETAIVQPSAITEIEEQPQILLEDNQIPVQKEIDSYLSITRTTYNNPNSDEMTTTIFQYNPLRDEVNEIYSFPYTSQYPYGVFSDTDKIVYFTSRDDNNHDQIYSYHVETKEVKQLTTSLRAVNQIIPTKDKLYFVASTDRVLRLGSLDKVSGDITYWADEDTNVETIVIDPEHEHIYVSAFSYSKDREVIEKQFVSDENVYTMPLFCVYETDYAFAHTKEVYSDYKWIKLLTFNPATSQMVALYDKEYNSLEPTEAVAIDVNSYDIKPFNLPPERILLDGGNFSIDGKGFYSISAINDERAVYYYNFETHDYKEIIDSQDGYINNIQLITTNQLSE